MTSSAPAPQLAGPRLRVDHVDAAFGELAVLDDISLDVAPGEIVSIIGRSGAGKSTLIRIIGGLLAPHSGSVLVDDESSEQARRKKQFGFMPQTPALLPWRNVIDNVSLVAEVNQNCGAATLDPMSALETVGLAHRAKDLPSQLSGGMAHRVALARALATGAPVLLLDEPMSSVDERTRHELYDELIRITDAGHQTVVLVTHNLTEAALLSDRVIVLGGSPARVRKEVVIDAPRPRTQALDNGELREPISALRVALQEADS